MIKNVTFLSKVMQARQRKQLGMTLIETMLVLMIGVLVIAGVVVLAQSVLANMKVNRSKQVLAQIGSGIQTSFSGATNTSGAYKGLDTTGLARFSFIPQDLVAGGKVYLPVGNGKTAEVRVAGGGTDGEYFTITVTDSAGACSDLVLTDFGANTLYDSTNSKVATGASGETVGMVKKTPVTSNARGSAFSAAAVAQCSGGSEAIVWNHA